MKILIAVEDRSFGEAMANFFASMAWSDQLEVKILHVIEPLHLTALRCHSPELMMSLDEEREVYPVQRTVI